MTEHGFETKHQRLIVKVGKRWHVRVGPLLVANFRPPDGAPWADQGWSTLSDGESPDEPRTIARFCGYGLRWPRMFVGLGGEHPWRGLAQRVSSWQGRKRRREMARRRVLGPQPSMEASEALIGRSIVGPGIGPDKR